jgi:hypothetical protein
MKKGIKAEVIYTFNYIDKFTCDVNLINSFGIKIFQNAYGIFPLTLPPARQSATAAARVWSMGE